MMNTPFCDRCHKANVQVRVSQRGREYKANVQIYPSGAYFRGLHTSKECDEHLAALEAKWQAKRDYDTDSLAYAQEGQALTARIAERMKNEGPEAWPECSAELDAHLDRMPKLSDYEN